MILAKENAKIAKRIKNISVYPSESVPFHYNSEYIGNGQYISSWGTGINSALLFEYDYKFWQVVE